MKKTDKTLDAIMKNNKGAIENDWKRYIIFKGIIDLKDFLKEWFTLDDREKLECYLYLEDGYDWDDAVYNARNKPRIIGEPGDTIAELCQEEFEDDFEYTIGKIGNPMLEFAVNCCLDWEHLANEWMLEASISETTDPETGWAVYFYNEY